MTHYEPRRQSGPDREISVAQAGALVVTQLGALIGSELALARAELVAQARQFSMGGIALATAAVAGLAGGLLFVAASVLAIALVLPAWAAALIVGGAFVLIAGLAAAWGAHRLSGAGKPMPMTTQSVREDLLVLRELHLSRDNGHHVTAGRPAAAASGPGDGA